MGLNEIEEEEEEGPLYACALDLILTDLSLGEESKSGLEMVRQIRQRERAYNRKRMYGKRMPIVAVTGTCTEQSKQQCYKAGFQVGSRRGRSAGFPG